MELHTDNFYENIDDYTFIKRIKVKEGYHYLYFKNSVLDEIKDTMSNILDTYLSRKDIKSFLIMFHDFRVLSSKDEYGAEYNKGYSYNSYDFHTLDTYDGSNIYIGSELINNNPTSERNLYGRFLMYDNIIIELVRNVEDNFAILLTDIPNIEVNDIVYADVYDDESRYSNRICRVMDVGFNHSKGGLDLRLIVLNSNEVILHRTVYNKNDGVRLAFKDSMDMTNRKSEWVRVNKDSE